MTRKCPICKKNLIYDEEQIEKGFHRNCLKEFSILLKIVSNYEAYPNERISAIIKELESIKTLFEEGYLLKDDYLYPKIVDPIPLLKEYLKNGGNDIIYLTISTNNSQDLTTYLLKNEFANQHPFPPHILENQIIHHPQCSKNMNNLGTFASIRVHRSDLTHHSIRCQICGEPFV